MKFIRSGIVLILLLPILSANAQQEASFRTQNGEMVLPVSPENSKEKRMKDFHNEIGISVPIIWSWSEALFYTLGSPAHREGKDLNYGIALSYSKVIWHGLFGQVGIGYFRQRFSIKRPFYYVTPDNTKPLVYTRYYSYDNIFRTAGIGYKEGFAKSLAAKGVISYNSFNSYRQRYAQKYFPEINEVYKKSLRIGEMINFNAGIEKNITNKISVECNIILPLYVHWNNDDLFINNYYSPGEQQIAIHKFSVGASVSCNYHF